MNGLTFVVTENNAKERINLVLQDNIDCLRSQYEILLHGQEITARTLYESTLETKNFIKIISLANTATGKEKEKLRQELAIILKNKYKRAEKKGVLQYQFALANNESFLRMHKPSKFGDNLSEIRYDFKEVQRTKRAVRGFTQGRVAHGFRNAFPLFDNDGIYIGAMEVSFSSDSFQEYLNNVSHIHTHFLVKKSIFDAKIWKRDDFVTNYSQSAEHKDYMLTLGDIHTKEKCIIENAIKMRPLRETINKKMLESVAFSIYLEHGDHIDVAAFLPIKNLKNKTVAWLVSYEESPFIAVTLKNMFVTRLISFLFSLALIYFVVKQSRSNALLEQKHTLLDNILNATDNIMFITDFKSVSFSNDRFKHLFNVKHSEEFNTNTNNNVLSVFLATKGYLHAGLLKKDEEIISLLKRVPEDERIVSVLDRHFDAKSFQLSVSKTNIQKDYLVTLSDITRLKEKHDINREKAYIDGLTRVYNRNKFDEILDDEILNATLYNKVFSIAIIDIDKFKDFNDTYGHLIGDEILVMMAQKINANVRETDTFARWGGEEFTILFKDTSVSTAKAVSEKLKDEIQKLEHPTAGSITASFGLTQFVNGDTINSIFKRCDEALYMAKENGRNRIEYL